MARSVRTAPTREERKARTRADLIAAADRLFTGNGFHATSLDAIADEAGYTKGAVYSSFESKEDASSPSTSSGQSAVSASMSASSRPPRGGATRARRPGACGGAAARPDDDDWLAVFFEFWARVVRRPALRARFAEIHLRVQGPLVEALRAARASTATCSRTTRAS